MIKPVLTAVYIIAMIFVIVVVDVLFFRGELWERLISNIGIVLLFIAFYFRFLK